MADRKAGIVLVVDDEKDVLDLAVIVLGGEGFRVEKAASGSAALDVLKTLKPDLILLDLKMPGITGSEFMSLYQANYTHHAPVVLMTASPRPEAEAAELGACDWLAKPFDLDDLIDTVHEHLG